MRISDFLFFHAYHTIKRMLGIDPVIGIAILSTIIIVAMLVVEAWRRWRR